MSSILWKSFNLCFSKFKCLPTINSFSPPSINPDHELDEEDETEGFYIFPATNNIHDNNNPSSLIFKNFNSLYDANSDINPISRPLTFSSSTTTTTTTTAAAAAAADDFSSSSDYNSDTDSIPDFSSAFASHRFFFSSPGISNSIFEPPEAPPQETVTVDGSVAVQTYSPDPYSDFRKSMMEMIESREMMADWEFLHELLLCYLTLNPKHTHKFIIGAFADVVVSLVSPPVDGTCRKTLNQPPAATSRLPL